MNTQYKTQDIKTMTVGELIAKLENYSDDELVCFEYNYGDKFGTMVVGEITQVGMAGLEYSSYHRSFAVKENTQENSVIVLR